MRYLHRISLMTLCVESTPKPVKCHNIIFGDLNFAIVRGYFDSSRTRSFMRKDESGYFATIAYVVDDDNMIEIDHISGVDCIKWNLSHYKEDINKKNKTYENLMFNFQRVLNVFNMGEEERNEAKAARKKAWDEQVKKMEEERLFAAKKAEEEQKKQEALKEQKICDAIEKIRTSGYYINEDEMIILLKRFNIWDEIPIKTRSLFTNGSFAGLRVADGKITNIYQYKGKRWSDNLRKIPERLIEAIRNL